MALRHQNRHIIYLSTPPLRNLTNLVCSLNRNLNQDISAISDFHLQILKCRMLIFSVPQLLVSPDAHDSSLINILFQKTDLDIQKFRTTLQKFKIKVIRSKEASAASLEACYKYSLGARLAPQWNMVGTNTLLAGRDFLTADVPLDAVTFGVHVAGDIITLDVKCYKARLGIINLGDLGLSPKTLEDFTNTTDAILTETSLLDQWLHVLPSLKRGRIINIHKQMPKSSAFNSYKDLRRHWKNIYGYRIPENGEGQLYCEIHFRPQAHLYTYPMCCLLPHEPLLTLPPDQKRIIDNFMNDLKSQIPSLLGQSCHYLLCDNVLPHQLSVASQPSPWSAVPTNPEGHGKKNAAGNEGKCIQSQI